MSTLVDIRVKEYGSLACVTEIHNKFPGERLQELLEQKLVIARKISLTLRVKSATNPLKLWLIRYSVTGGKA